MQVLDLARLDHLVVLVELPLLVQVVVELVEMVVPQMVIAVGGLLVEVLADIVEMVEMVVFGRQEVHIYLVLQVVLLAVVEQVVLLHGVIEQVLVYLEKDQLVL
jgi:hypothetical protein